MKDASRSLVRTVQNNLMDSAKQESFDLFLLGQTYGNAAFDRATNILQPNVMRGKFLDNFKTKSLKAQILDNFKRIHKLCEISVSK